MSASIISAPPPQCWVGAVLYTAASGRGKNGHPLTTVNVFYKYEVLAVLPSECLKESICSMTSLCSSGMFKKKKERKRGTEKKSLLLARRTFRLDLPFG